MYTFWSHLLVKRATLSFVRITYNHRVCILLDLLWKASPSLLSLSLSFSLCVSYGTLKGGAIKTADPRSVLLVRTRNDDRDHVFLLIRIYFSREMSAVMRDRWTSLEHPLSLSLFDRGSVSSSVWNRFQLSRKFYYLKYTHFQSLAQLKLKQLKVVMSNEVPKRQ